MWCCLIEWVGVLDSCLYECLLNLLKIDLWIDLSLIYYAFIYLINDQILVIFYLFISMCKSSGIDLESILILRNT